MKSFVAPTPEARGRNIKVTAIALGMLAIGLFLLPMIGALLA